MKSALFVSVAVLLLAGSMPGLAAPTMPPPPPAAAPHDVTFAQVKAVADTWWDKMDANHDGRIDAADHDARLLERFAKWDTNHDGVISKDEFLAFAHAREAKWRGHGPDRPPPEADGGDRRGPGQREDRFVAMAIAAPAFHEARKDGVITRAAFDAAVKARFDTLDVNHDGTLTREELHAAGHRRWGHQGREWGHRRDGDMPPPPPPPPGQ